MDTATQSLFSSKLTALLSNPRHADRANVLATARAAWERLRAEARTPADLATVERWRCRLAGIEGGHGVDRLLSLIDGSCSNAERAQSKSDAAKPAAEARAALAALEALVAGARARVEEL